MKMEIKNSNWIEVTMKTNLISSDVHVQDWDFFSEICTLRLWIYDKQRKLKLISYNKV